MVLSKFAGNVGEWVVSVSAGWKIYTSWPVERVVSLAELHSQKFESRRWKCLDPQKLQEQNQAGLGKK